MNTYRESQQRHFPLALLAVLASGVLAVLVLADHAAAGDIQPNALNFGSVRVGATVEGSVRIFRGAADAKGLVAKVEPPAFVRVDETKVGSQKFGAIDRGFCDLSVSVKTERTGTFAGEIHVEVGRERFAVPVSVTVRPQMPHLTRLLVVETPFGKYSTNDATQFAPWLDLVAESHLDVHYIDSQRGLPVFRKVDLAKIDVVLVGMEGLINLLDSDIAGLKQFTERGGRTILPANYFFRGTVEKANQLLVPYGLRMADAESRGQHEFTLGAAEIKDDPLTHGLKSLYFHRPSPVAVEDAQKGRILVASPENAGQGFVAVARAGQGDVIALGASLWWHWLYNGKARGADNAALLANLLDKREKSK
jgi:hypothetical protein